MTKKLKLGYEQRLLSDMEEKLLAKLYLGKPGEFNGKKFKTSCVAALIHARAITGRDIETGLVINEEKTGDWSGACMYFVVIDHISNIFCKPYLHVEDRFLQCLREFGGLDKKTAKTIYALRNSLLHQFNLYNENDGYIFSVNRDIKLLVKPSLKIWDGMFKRFSFEKEGENVNDYTTVVSLRKLGDLAEKIYSSLLEKLELNQLKISIPKDLDIYVFLAFNSIGY